MKYRFTTAITKEGKWFVAACLELGVVSQGRSVKSAEKNLKEAVELFLEDNREAQKKLSGAKPLIRTLEVSYA